jgi:hypothetical protein
MLSRFLGNFLYKLANSFLLYQWKDKSFVPLSKKRFVSIRASLAVTEKMRTEKVKIQILPGDHSYD